MKTLSLTFGIIGILFLLLGLYLLFSLTDTTGYLTFICFIAGCISTSLFLITQNLLNTDEQK